MKEKLFVLMQEGYQEIQALVADLSEAELAAAGSREQWSIKDTLGHITEWAQRFSDSLNGIEQTFFPEGGEALDAENARIYEKYRVQSWDEVLAAVKRVYEAMGEHVQNLSEEDLASTGRLTQQGDRPLWRLVVGNLYSHPILHLCYVYLARGNNETVLRLNEDSAHHLLELDVSPAWQGTTLYNLACNYALVGEKSKAITFLSQALHFEPRLIEWSKQDADLISLRDDPEYQAIYEQQQS